MYKCLFCGLDSPSEKARFCSACGPDGPAKDWISGDIDQPQKVTQYVSALSEYYFDAQDSNSVEKYSLRIRQKLKISHDTHVSIISKLAKQKQAVEHLKNFRFEFNENVIDAYAGNDTFLNFRYTNLSEEDFFKISLFWDDPSTTDRIDINAETKSLVKPLSSVTIGASAVFDRIGIKEISDLQITITDQLGERAKFRAEPFSFKVGNPDQKITQNISTHNQISIEGRGVIDASGMGAEKNSTLPTANNQPKWVNLNFSFLSSTGQFSEENPVVEAKSTALQPTQETFENSKQLKESSTEFKNGDLLSVLQAANSGNPTAQYELGVMYCTGRGVALDEEKAADWFRKAAEQGDAVAQWSIGVGYLNGQGVAKNHDKAADWFRKSAEQGNRMGQSYLADMYFNGHGVAKDDEIAARWYRMSAEQGFVAAQFAIAGMYEDGVGVAKNDEKASDWYRKAAEQGDADAQYQIGANYLYGIGVAKDDEKAVDWLKKSAEQGNVYAQHEIGLCYSNGIGVAKNDEKAADWTRKAAEQGNAEAQYQLGRLYQLGEGVAKNAEKATDWFQKSAEQGNAQAIEYLESVNLAASSSIEEISNDDEDDTTSDIDNDAVVSDSRIDYQDGSYYEGEVKNGVAHGIGTYTFANEDYMTGNFVNGSMLDDTAIYEFANGDTYEGSMVGSVFSGFGTRTFGGDYVGHSYTGNFENSKFNGEGTYTFADGSTNVGQFKDGKFVPESSGAQEYVSSNGQTGENNFNVNDSSTKDIILHFATKKLGSLGQHFYINNGDKFTKKINNFSNSFSEVHYKKFNLETDTPLLFYDGTILGSGKDGIAFTDKYIFAKGCLGRSVKHIDILYSQIQNVRSDNNRRPNEIYIESSGHNELIELKLIYIEIDDISLIVQMLNEIIRRP